MWAAIASTLGNVWDKISGSNESSANRRATIHANNLNIAAQKEALQNSVQWRVADAEKAGIHPGLALGMQPMQIAPSYMPATRSRDHSLMGEMGQNVSRAIQSMQTARERKDALWNAEVINKLSIERASLENDLLRTQIARNSADQIGPPAPELTMGGMAPSPARVQPRPATPRINSAHDIAREAGNITSYRYARNPSGGLGVVRSSDMQEALEDDFFGNVDWWARHRVAPALSGLRPPSTREFPLPPGQFWKWDAMRQEFRPARRTRYRDGRPLEYWIRRR